MQPFLLSDAKSGIAILLITILVIIVILVLRDVFAWYTKQNEVIKLLKRNNELLGKLVGEPEPEKKQ